MFYFSSDIHFNDNQTLTNENRPFKNTKRYDRYVIKTWNKQATKNDTIYVIGDFMDCDGEGYDSWRKSILYVKKIKADVILIMGNNEDRIVEYYFDNNYENFRNYCISVGFKDVYKNLTIKINDKECYLIHNPIEYKKGIINLFGHTHSAGGIYKPFGLNVGCDLNHFRLYSEADIEFFLEKKRIYWDKDKSLNMNFND